MKKGTHPFIEDARRRCRVTRLLIAAALAAAPALACDPALQATVTASPDRHDERDALARSCARAGRFDEALAHYDLLLAADGNNADWHEILESLP